MFKFAQTKVEKRQFCRLSQNWVLKVDLGTYLRDKHGHLFLWYFDIFGPLFKVGQTKVENMHFDRLSRNSNFKVDLDTHLRNKHGHRFLWDFELFWASFKVGQTKVQNMHFCRLSQNWVLKVDLDTHYEIWNYFSARLRLVKLGLKRYTFVDFLAIGFCKWI